jgi:Carboxypeptidase regulatory-like domain
VVSRWSAVLLLGLILGALFVGVPRDPPPPAEERTPVAPASDPEPAQSPVPAKPPRSSATPKSEAESAFAAMVRGLLSGPVLLSGRVVTPDGRPVFDAVVKVGRPGGLILSAPTRRVGAWRAYTDVNGRYGIRSPAGQDELPSRLRVTARADGRVAIIDRLEVLAVPYVMPDLVLQNALEIRGRIVNSRREPVPDVEARFRVSREGLGGAVRLEGLSDADGRVSTPSIPRRDDWTIALEIVHAAHPAVEVEIDLSDQLAGTPFEVVLTTGMEVRGRVVSADGSPAEKIRVVAAVDGSPVFHLQTTVGKEGRFTLQGVPITGARLFLYLDRQRKIGILETSRCLPVRTDEIRGRHGDVIDLGVIRIDALGTIRGTVVAPDGAPAFRAKVWVEYATSGHGSRSARTRKDGRFEITNVPDGNLVLWVNKTYPTRGTVIAKKEAVHPGDNVHIELPAGGMIVFHFHAATDRTGSLSIRRPMVIRERLRETGDRDLGISMYSRIGIGGGAEVRTRAIWRFEAEPGRYRATVTAEGYLSVKFSEVEVADDHETHLDVFLEKN